MATRRGYSDETKAKALVYVDLECGGNVAEAARALGIPQVTLNEWTLGRRTSEEVMQKATATRIELADKIDKLLELSIASIVDNPQRLIDCHVGEIAQMVKATVPSSQLLRDKATVILAAEQPQSPEEAERELALILTKHLPSVDTSESD